MEGIRVDAAGIRGRYRRGSDPRHTPTSAWCSREEPEHGVPAGASAAWLQRPFGVLAHAIPSGSSPGEKPPVTSRFATSTTVMWLAFVLAMNA